MILLVLILGSIVSLTIKWIYQRYRHMTLLSRNGIPGPPLTSLSQYIYGHLFDTGCGLAIHDPRLFTKWFAEYGPIVGFYYGYTPMIIIDDPEFYRTVMIKQFSSYPNRMKHFPSWTGDPKEKLSVMLARDRKWKQLRATLSPIFSSSKIKAMFSLIEDATDAFIDQLKLTQEAGSVDIHPSANKVVLDIIARTAFRLNAPIQNPHSDHPFVQAADTFVSSGFLMKLAFCIPELEPIINLFRRAMIWIKKQQGIPGLWYFYGLSRAAASMRISQREQQTSKHNDLLELMLNAKHDSCSDAKADSGLNQDEIEANAMMFIVAGYEATGSQMSFLVHNLVNHPEIQQRCFEEVVKVSAEEGRLTFDSLAKLEYLEWVLLESMRIYPTTTNFITRSVEVDDLSWRTYKIPRGSSVLVPLHHFQHRADLWTDPEAFQPERWTHASNWMNMPEYQPFGIGPRSCLAARFAMIMMKYTIARLLLSYHLVPSPRTLVGDAKPDYAQFDTQPKKGIHVSLKPRN